MKKEDFLFLLTKKEYLSEDELIGELKSKLPELLKIDENQIVEAPNKIDILIKTKGEVVYYPLVIEAKLHRMVVKYDDSDYVAAGKEMAKTCLDFKCGYGVIVSEKECKLLKFGYNEGKSRSWEIDELPSMADMETELETKEKEEYKTQKKTGKYVLGLIGIAVVLVGLWFGVGYVLQKIMLAKIPF